MLSSKKISIEEFNSKEKNFLQYFFQWKIASFYHYQLYVICFEEFLSLLKFLSILFQWLHIKW